MNPHYPLVAERAAHRCEYCHAPEVVFEEPESFTDLIFASETSLDFWDNPIDDEDWNDA